MSSRADILQLVQTLSSGLADPNTCNTFFDEVVEQLAASSEHIVATELLPVAPRVGTFLLDTPHIQLLAAFFGGRQLSMVTASEMDSVSLIWRDQTGHPRSYIEETEADRSFRIFPRPNAPSGAFDFSATGLDYPTDAIQVLVTERRDSLPDEISLPVALLILGREFARPSDHSKQDLSKFYEQFGQMLLTLVV